MKSCDIHWVCHEGRGVMKQQVTLLFKSWNMSPCKTTIIETRSWHLMESRMKEYLMKGIVYEQFYSPHHNCSAGVYQCSVDRWKGNTVGIVSRPLSHMNTMRWNVLCAFAIRHKNETNGHLLELTRVVKHMNETGVEMIKWEFGSICLL